MIIKSKLVKLAKKGDKQAFQALIHEEKEKLYKMAYIYMKNENDALEVFQETIYKALEAISSLRHNDYFSTWITRILINTALNSLKKTKDLIPMNPAILEHFEESVHEKSEVQLDLLNALDAIEEKYKTVLLLRYYQDYTIGQISTFLSCPEGTVKTNIRRGLALLRTKLKGVYTDDRQNSRI